MRKAIFAYYYAPGTGPGENPRPARLRPLPVADTAPAKPREAPAPVHPTEPDEVAPIPTALAEPIPDMAEAPAGQDAAPANDDPAPPLLPDDLQDEPTAPVATAAPDADGAAAEPGQDAAADRNAVTAQDADVLPDGPEPIPPAEPTADHDTDRAEAFEEEPFGIDDDGDEREPDITPAPSQPDTIEPDPIEPENAAAEREPPVDEAVALPSEIPAAVAAEPATTPDPAPNGAPDSAPAPFEPAAPEPAVAAAPALAPHDPDPVLPEPAISEPAISESVVSGPAFPAPSVHAEPISPADVSSDPAAIVPPAPDISAKPPYVLPAHLAMQSMTAIPHDVLGLFAPEAITMQARSGVGDSVAMGPPNAGMYRPDGFRPAPWSGLAYEMAPDDGRGMCAGTRLLTARGEVAVEQLLPSDRVLGLRGPRLARIATITRRALSAANRADGPLRIPAGALGGDQPSRDLLVGPDQVLFPDGAEPVLAHTLGEPGGPARPAGLSYAELFQVALVPYPGAEDGDVLLADGVFIASRGRDASAAE